jgi:HNH endonuclease
MDDAKTEELGSLAVAPRPSHPQDNWLEFIGAGVAGGFASSVGADVYNDVKAVCRAAVEKYRDQRSDPDEEQVWMHQLIAEASMGLCPPGYKLVHLNGDGLDNRRANLAYVPVSDPRPAAPLNPRSPGFLTEAVATNNKPVATRKKRRKSNMRHR